MHDFPTYSCDDRTLQVLSSSEVLAAIRSPAAVDESTDGQMVMRLSCMRDNPTPQTTDVDWSKCQDFKWYTEALLRSSVSEEVTVNLYAASHTQGHCL